VNNTNDDRVNKLIVEELLIRTNQLKKVTAEKKLFIDDVVFKRSIGRNIENAIEDLNLSVSVDNVFRRISPAFSSFIPFSDGTIVFQSFHGVSIVSMPADSLLTLSTPAMHCIMYIIPCLP